MPFLGTLLTLAGFAIGLGAVTVIDLHGFLARKSPYWTLATTRAHKVTKPLIWLGTLLLTAGTVTLYWPLTSTQSHVMLAIQAALIANGCYLSFVISPFLLKQEKAGNAEKLLPAGMQRRITMSFLVSFTGWWTLVALTAITFVK